MPVSETVGPLLERVSERGALNETLEAAADGRGGLVVVDGPAGIGKSSLLRETRAVAERDGFQVLTGIGSPLEQELSFGIVLQLFEGVLARASSGERSELLDGAARLAAPVFEHGKPPAAAAEEPENRTLSILHGLHWLAANLALRSPLLIEVDDAHQCDVPSLRFIHYLAQRVDEHAIAIVLAARSGELVDPQGAQTLDELRAHHHARVLEPQALSAGAVSSVVRESFPNAEERFCQACGQASAGNPFYLRSLLLALEADGAPPSAAGAERVSKLGARAVSRSVLTRFARLPPGVRALADACSVLGEGCSLDEAARLGELDHEDAVAAADALAAAETLAAGEPLSFVHPVVREALYQELPPARRARLHLQAAELLRGRSPEAAAAHVLLAQRGGDQWVVELLSDAAARASERGDPAAAARYFARALEEPAAAERRGDLLFGLGLAQTAAGDPSGGDRIIEAAGSLADPMQRAMALMNMGRLLAMRARFGESARVFARAGEELRASGEPLPEGAKLLELWAQGGYALAGTRDTASCVEARRTLAGLAEERGFEADAIGRSVLAFEGVERIHAARPASEAVELERRLAQIEPSEDPTDVISFGVVSIALALCGEVAEADRVVAALAEVVERRGSALEQTSIAYVRMIVAYQRGDLTDAMRQALTVTDGHRLGFGAGLATSYAVLTRGHLDRGELDEARAALERGLPEANAADQFLAPFALEARAAVRQAAGDRSGALEDFLEAGRLLEGRGIRNPAMSVQNWRSGAAQALAGLGARERAAELAREELELAEGFGVPAPLGAALRTAGLIAVGEQSIELLRRSVEALRSCPSELELARSLSAHGAALRRAKRRRECREPLREATELAQRCGAPAIAEGALTELRASGARPRRIELRGVESLTPSELRIAELAASGLSNREIAQQLYLTVKTVESHLGRVYRKLEIRSRRELPGVLESSQQRNP
jgi:DNA-binding CsgD family transcriptional regulator